MSCTTCHEGGCRCTGYSKVTDVIGYDRRTRRSRRVLVTVRGRHEGASSHLNASRQVLPLDIQLASPMTADVGLLSILFSSHVHLLPSLCSILILNPFHTVPLSPPFIRVST